MPETGTGSWIKLVKSDGTPIGAENATFSTRPVSGFSRLGMWIEVSGQSSLDINPSMSVTNDGGTTTALFPTGSNSGSQALMLNITANGIYFEWWETCIPAQPPPPASGSSPDYGAIITVTFVAGSANFDIWALVM